MAARPSFGTNTIAMNTTIMPMNKRLIALPSRRCAAVASRRGCARVSSNEQMLMMVNSPPMNAPIHWLNGSGRGTTP
jgi:hypothetical protein